MKKSGRRKLVLVGTGVVHTFKYLDLIASYFDEILLITDKPKPDLKVKQFTFDFSLRSPLQITAKINKLRTAIKDFNPDIVHVHQANSCAFYTIKACNKNYPLVVTAWGSDILSTPSKGFLYRKMLKYILKNADCFTSDALFMANEMRRMAGKKHLEILVANFGIDITPTPLEKEDLIYSNRQLTALYRIDKIIALFKEFVSSDGKHRHWKLAIAATGPEESKLRDIVKKNHLEDSVQFYGWVDKVMNSNLYAKAKIYISIPESDATSISLLEAMASGCLPVVSDLPANREWIRDGVNGIIYKEGLENPFLRALAIDAGTATAMNKEIIDTEGTKEANKEKFIAMYENMLHGK
ncbi:MAG: glycosyltransferase family 4 protein [Bacteroidetes bacterium]|nr:glycosyltransferase family 4 protein [Bacteroidota bacterium]